jgi:hypothetical protein
MNKALITLILSMTVALPQTVANIDLTGAPKSLPKSRRASAGNSGGMIYDGPKNGTRLDPPPAPFSIRVARLLESTDPEAGRGALEIVLTNTSKDFIEIPASPEVAALLDTPAPLRRVLSFGICVNPCGVDDIIGNVEAGSNGDHAESIVGLRPGASMTFKLPFDKRAAARKVSASGRTFAELSVSAGLFDLQIDKEGEFLQGVGQTIHSVNSLKWTSSSQ